MRCPNPEAENDNHYDMCLTGVWCEAHNRTVYYCHDLGVLWCDGLQDDGTWQYHRIDVWSEEE